MTRLLLIAVLLAAVGMVPGRASAYTVFPVRPLFELEHAMLQPSDVAVGKDRKVYVVDGVNNSIKVFDDRGEFLFAFGKKGTGPGEFNNPLGVTADSSGKVYVADSQNHRVQIFGPGGEWRQTLDIVSAKGDKPSDPTDVALDEGKKQLYVVDNDNHHVLVYSLDTFKQVAVWGSEGELREQFQYPFFIAVGIDSSVFIVDVINTRMQVYSPQGAVMSTVGGWGVDLGQFYRPKGVCTDPENQVFVSDSYLGVIQVFNRYGHFKGVVGDENGAVMKWKTPVGLAIDDLKRLYVVDMVTNRVKVYSLLDKKIDKP